MMKTSYYYFDTLPSKTKVKAFTRGDNFIYKDSKIISKNHSQLSLNFPYCGYSRISQLLFSYVHYKLRRHYKHNGKEIRVLGNVKIG